MSGGYFDYNQYSMISIVENLNRRIKENPNSDWQLAASTLVEFAKVADELEILYEKVRVIDYLLSGDSGEDTFLERLAECNN